MADAPDRVVLAVFLMIASLTAMAFSDALVKLSSGELGLWQIFVVRSSAATLALFAIAKVRGRSLFVSALGWSALRSALLIGCWLSYYAGLPFLELSVAAVIIYTSPIMIVLLSGWFLGESVSARGWLGVALGFLGAGVILRPGGDDVGPAALLPLIAAACYAASMTLTRGPCRNEDALALAIVLHLGFVSVGLAGTAGVALLDPDPGAFGFLLGPWGAMGARELGLLAFLGLLAAGYFYGVAMAYQIAPAPIVATFDYGYLVAAFFWGWLFFGERPDAWMLAGAASIAAGGLLVALPRKRS